MSTNFEEITEKVVTSKTKKSTKTSKKSTSSKKVPKSISSKSTKSSSKSEVNKSIKAPTVQANAKRKVSKPTINKPDLKTTKLVNDLQIENEIKVQPKRTIKNIKPKTTSKTNITQKELEIKNKKINSPISKKEKTVEKVKRTIKLNLNNNKKSTHEADTSINQNSAFFYEPSIFEKYNIDITTAENDFEQPIEIVIEDTNLENNDTTQITNTENSNLDEEITIEIEDVELPATEIVDLEQQDNSSQNENSNDDLLEIETIVDEKIQTDSESIIETILIDEFQDDLVSNIETITIEDEIIDEIKSTTESFVETETAQENQIDTEEETQNDLEISIEDINLEESLLDVDSEILENLIQNDNFEIPSENTDQQIENNLENEIVVTSDEENVEEEKAVADSVSNNSPIGKFFDSSIPPISQNVTFSKIKNSIFSNISPIFKKFTFEEANLLNNNNNNQIEDEIENIDSTTSIVSNESIINDFNSLTDNNIVEMSTENAAPVTIPAIDITSATYQSNTEPLIDDTTYNNILTQESPTSIDDLELNELFDEELNKKLDKEIDEIINSSKKSKKRNNSEKSNSTSNISDNLPLEDYDLEETLEQVEEYTYSEDFDCNNNSSENAEEYNDEAFSIETYFGLDTLTDDDFKDEINTIKEKNKDVKEALQNTKLDTAKKEPIDEVLDSNENTSTETNSEISTISKLLENFNQTLNTLSDRISSLEIGKAQPIIDTSDEITDIDDIDEDDLIEEIDIQPEDLDNLLDNNEQENELLDIADTNIEDILNDSDISNLLEEDLSIDLENEQLEDSTSNSDDEIKTVENILSESLSSNTFELKDNFKNKLLSEILTSENELNNNLNTDNEASSDFLKVIECLSKAINELENEPSEEFTEQIEQTQTQPIIGEPFDDTSLITDEELYESLISEELLVEEPSILLEDKEKLIKESSVPEQKNSITQKEEVSDLPRELSGDSNIVEGKSINILIDKDDIFSISILNETYEIVADFDGISVLSQNIHISTPKNNFFVKIGNKYIEIHNHKDHFIVHTNFEDVEFANAINNVGFAKKKNKIELNIKEAFKLASVNNRIELSMLNKTIASIKDTPITQIDEGSICDNKTLLISEETQKVYLPYTISEVMNKLKYNDEYQSVQEVVDNEYTVPLSAFRMPIISRFREAYRFMRQKENSSIYAAVDLAVELMFNSNLNPAVIRAAKDLKELNIYLDCLYENEVEKFDCFKIIYKVLPKIK